MSIIGTISITHSVDCKACGYEAKGGTLKAAYARMVLHLRLCEETYIKTGERHSIWWTIKCLYQLWRWKQR